jgi:uncharacterized protein
MAAVVTTKGIALITGASMGLGEELARLFAKDGHGLVLAARSEAKLEALAKQLKEAHGIEVHVAKTDLTDPKAPERLRDFVKERGLEISFLVNNAGFGSSGAFLDLPLEKELEMIEVNITALTKLTHLFTKPMKDRGFGRVLNIASTAGFQPGPFMATYYATKAFVVSFSESLAFELKGTGVTVTCHCPGATATQFAMTAGNARSRLFQRPGVAKATDVAQHAYRAMMRGSVLSIHGALNWIAMESLRISPRSVVRSIAARLNQTAG